MAKEINPAKGEAETITLNVRLKPNAEAKQPVLANYSTVGVAQGIAYVDFGFIEPPVIAAAVRQVQESGTVPKNLEGEMATRVALPIEAVFRLQQQLTQVLRSLQQTQPPKKS